MTTRPQVRVERADGVATVTIDNPGRKNSLTFAGFAELRDALTEIGHTPTDRAVILTGAGGAFCAGADLSGGVPEGGTVAIMQQIHEAARALHRLPQPVISAVDGPAVGAGMSLALAADVVVAAESAYFSMIFVKRGLVPDFGSSWLLPRIVGVHTARRLALLGDTISAEQALALGIVSEVVPSADLAANAAGLAQRLAAGPPIAMALTKRLFAVTMSNSFDEQLDAEAAAASVASATEDVAEAFRAFAEKRAPQFLGR